MARVRKVARGSQDVKVHPSEVDCFYQEIRGSNGQKLVHLTTFGSDDRQSKPKSSQSLQLDERAARELVAVFRATFPGI